MATQILKGLSKADNLHASVMVRLADLTAYTSGIPGNVMFRLAEGLVEAGWRVDMKRAKRTFHEHGDEGDDRLLAGKRAIVRVEPVYPGSPTAADWIHAEDRSLTSLWACHLVPATPNAVTFDVEVAEFRLNAFRQLFAVVRQWGLRADELAVLGMVDRLFAATP